MRTELPPIKRTVVKPMSSLLLTKEDGRVWDGKLSVWEYCVQAENERREGEIGGKQAVLEPSKITFLKGL